MQEITDAIKEYAITNGDKTVNECLDDILSIVSKNFGFASMNSFIRGMADHEENGVDREYFQRVVSRDGKTVFRDWSPAVKKQSISNWMNKHHPNEYGWVLEDKHDIYREGQKRWWRGKASGDAPTINGL